MKTVEVVAAVIIHENKILCLQRNDSKFDYIAYKYEFPGGKVEENETSELALIREISEELNLTIEIKEHFLTVDHSYPDFRIIMHSYICNCNSTELILNEHVDFKWLSKDELFQLDWAAADIPIVEKLSSSR
ncbi:(deoxy)nucleoside triphosphate pyrophosphohydrolase [Flavobacterium sp.]|jgi:8-oxo-dGTP diphosphatase|uniref:(deoxy)nucleoside triphosphate pyrophosphohydrolase n=1 Tax=Flavobacterium sp. TaxID=239 RepID=UPI0022C90D31|nr:(deoxy)nucleoside triphosphate pyrophosphohydrolase [Flavobacterium sp.]MCZ8145268.1 (deoxy)nucleoside triphosphate pyrophosphohydrolase [Flavobacterium sp.]MCZ8366807.1 (deoxy)nucleoside triphosphate pyrophosphohydrolase [Flavobacterium sp.]